MKRRLLSSTAMLTALLTSAPAIAVGQERRGSHNEGSSRGSQAQSAPRVEGRAVERAVPRHEAAPSVNVAPRVARPEIARPEIVRPNVVRPNVVAPVRPYDARSYGARPYVARPYVARPYYAPRPYYQPRGFFE